MLPFNIRNRFALNAAQANTSAHTHCITSYSIDLQINGIFSLVAVVAAVDTVETSLPHFYLLFEGASSVARVFKENPLLVKSTINESVGGQTMMMLHSFFHQLRITALPPNLSLSQPCIRSVHRSQGHSTGSVSLCSFILIKRGVVFVRTIILLLPVSVSNNCQTIYPNQSY